MNRCTPLCFCGGGRRRGGGGAGNRIDRCCAVSSRVGTRGVVGGVDVEDGARRRAGGAGVRARGDDLRKHHTGFLLNGRGVGVDVNPPDAAVVGAASGEAPPQCNQASWCRAEAL